MALQSSGAISISQIKAELGSSSNSLRDLSAAAGKSTPDAMSEFYGYSAAPPPPPCYIANYDGSITVSWYPPAGDSQTSSGGVGTYSDDCVSGTMFSGLYGDWYLSSTGPGTYWDKTYGEGTSGAFLFSVLLDNGNTGGTFSYYITPPGPYGFAGVYASESNYAYSAYDHNYSYLYATGGAETSGTAGSYYSFSSNIFFTYG